jgi:hypothetical protein
LGHWFWIRTLAPNKSKCKQDYLITSVFKFRNVGFEETVLNTTPVFRDNKACSIFVVYGVQLPFYGILVWAVPKEGFWLLRKRY